MMESSLPEEVLMTWQRSSLYGRDGSTEVPPKNELDYLMQFLQQEVESEEQRKLARAGFGTSIDSSQKSGKGKGNRIMKETASMAAGFFAGNTAACIFCDKNHQFC